MSILADTKLTFRMLNRSRGFAAASILTLVFGILLNTAAFGVVNAIWFRPLPFRSGERIVILNQRNAREGRESAFSYVDLTDYQARNTVFEGLAAFSEAPYNVNGVGSAKGEPAQVQGGAMSANTMDLLGIRPIAGRSFTAEEQATGAPVVLIGEQLWRNRFASDPQMVGREVKVDGRPMTVIGILPYEFRFIYSGYDLYLPIPLQSMRAPRSERSFAVLGRLKPGISVVRASAEMASIAGRLAEGYSEANRGWTADVTPYRDFMQRRNGQYRILLVAAGLVLLIVCANVSSLFLARAATRQREIAIRMALGARRSAIIRQMLTEGMAIALAAGALAAIGAYWLRQILVASVPQLRFLEMDFRVLAYTLAMSIAAGLMFGVAPAIAASRPDLIHVIKAGGQGCSATRGTRLRNVLVVAEIALGLMLVAGAALLTKTIASLRYVDVGFETDRMIVAEISPRGNRYAEAGAVRQFCTDIRHKAEAVPGIQAAAVARFAPLTYGASPAQVQFDNQARGSSGEAMLLATNVVSPQYLKVLGVRLLAGRPFEASDREGTPRVALVNQAFAGKLAPAGEAPSALGQRVKIGDGEWLTIVGVFANARQALNEPAYPEVLMSDAQSSVESINVVIRTATAAAGVATAVARSLREVDPDLPIHGPTTLEGWIENFYPIVMVYGLAAFAAVAMVLATLGLYAVVAHAVLRRTQEIGIRIAMGACRGSVLQLVLGHTLKLASVGAAIGIGGAFLVARILEGFLVGASPADPLVIGGVTAVLCLVAAVAGLVPALRASRIDPVAALRCE